MGEGTTIGWQRKISLGDFQLQLDPQIAAEIQRILGRQSALTLRSRIAKPNWSFYTQQRLNLLPAPAQPVSPQRPQSPAFNFGSPPKPATPLVTPGKGPETPRAGTFGDVMKALWAVPEVQKSATSMLDTIAAPLRQSWAQSSTAEKVLVISHAATIAGPTIAALMGNNPARRGTLKFIADVSPLPVPGVKGMSFELKYQEGDDWPNGFVVNFDLGEYLQAPSAKKK